MMGVSSSLHHSRAYRHFLFTGGVDPFSLISLMTGWVLMKRARVLDFEPQTRYQHASAFSITESSAAGAIIEVPSEGASPSLRPITDFLTAKLYNVRRNKDDGDPLFPQNQCPLSNLNKVSSLIGHIIAPKMN